MKPLRTHININRWNKLSLMEQMANIGSEVERAIKWRSKNEPYFRLAYFRALELMEYTINDAKNKYRGFSSHCKILPNVVK